eukprot:jgi/Tetstr1/447603/TSEL_034964.t1
MAGVRLAIRKAQDHERETEVASLEQQPAGQHAREGLLAPEAAAEQQSAGQPAGEELPALEAAMERQQARQQACEELPAQEAVEQHNTGHRAGEELLAEEAAVEQQPAGQPEGEELHAQEAAVEQHQAGHRAGKELLAEEAAVEQPQTVEEDMPLSDEDDSDFVAEESDVDDDIAEIVAMSSSTSAPPERDEAIDLCEDIDAREEDVIDLLDDDEDVPPVATFKQMFEDSVKHVQTFVEERIEQATWGGEQYRVVPPAVDSEIGQVLKTLQQLDPTLQDVSVTRRELNKYPAPEKVLLNHTHVDPKDKASKLHYMPYVEAMQQPFSAEHQPSKIMKEAARKGKLVDGTPTAAPTGRRGRDRADGEPHSMAALRACRQAAKDAFQEAQDGLDYICGGQPLPEDHPYHKAELRVGEAEMRHRHVKMWPCDSHQRHPKAPNGLTWLRVSA